MRPVRMALPILVLAWLATQTAHPCGPDHVVRAYLNQRFWQPLAKSHEEAWPPRRRDQAFAGMGRPAGGALARAHAAYQAVERQRRQPAVVPARLLVEAQTALAAARTASLPGADAEELALMECKVTLRGAEQRREELPQVKARLERFLATARQPRLISEARGWLGRVHYLLGEYHAAARIYLAELENPRSVFDRESLLLSLRLVFPYNGSSARLADHLEEYFDDPRRALFVVDLVTNPVYSDPKEYAARQEVGRRALAALDGHEELFRRGADSERLALALMRAALYQGDHEQARAYAERLPESSARRAGPEFRWMAGVAAVLAGRQAEAEPHLRAVADSRRAPDRYRAMALQGLMGVYLHQGRVPDAIEAALRFEARDRPHLEDSEAAPWFEAYFTNAWLLDLPYLLDFQASEDDLRTTLARLDRGRTAWISSRDWERPTSRRAQDVVTYALAVRLAQREEYGEAARLYARVNARVRARRMKEAARLHAAAQADGVSPAARLEARYRYAAFLAEHSTQVFFDDLLWTGYQRYALLDPPPQDFCERVEMGNPFCAQKAATMLAPEARAALVERERQVRDAQEERWRAYLLLDAVVREAGPGELARRAARKAVEALDGINTERFGREPEVEEARRRLARAALS